MTPLHVPLSFPKKATRAPYGKAEAASCDVGTPPPDLIAQRRARPHLASDMTGRLEASLTLGGKTREDKSRGDEGGEVGDVHLQTKQQQVRGGVSGCGGGPRGAE